MPVGDTRKPLFLSQPRAPARQEGTMLDHRILLVSLLLSFLAFSAVPSFVQSPPVDLSAARVLPIEVEPDGAASVGDESW